MTDRELEELRTEFRSHCEVFGSVYKAEHGRPPEGSAVLRAMLDVMADVLLQAPPDIRPKLFSRVVMALAMAIELTPADIVLELERAGDVPARLDS